VRIACAQDEGPEENGKKAKKSWNDDGSENEGKQGNRESGNQRINQGSPPVIHLVH
jgi:hypothetical protein